MQESQNKFLQLVRLFLDLFLQAGAEILEFFLLVLGRFEDTKAHFEINWPLVNWMIFQNFVTFSEYIYFNVNSSPTTH